LHASEVTDLLRENTVASADHRLVPQPVSGAQSRMKVAQLRVGQHVASHYGDALRVERADVPQRVRRNDDAAGPAVPRVLPPVLLASAVEIVPAQSVVESQPRIRLQGIHDENAGFAGDARAVDKWIEALAGERQSEQEVGIRLVAQAAVESETAESRIRYRAAEYTLPLQLASELEYVPARGPGEGVGERVQLVIAQNAAALGGKAGDPDDVDGGRSLGLETGLVHALQAHLLNCHVGPQRLHARRFAAVLHVVILQSIAERIDQRRREHVSVTHHPSGMPAVPRPRESRERSRQNIGRVAPDIAAEDGVLLAEIVVDPNL